jgi:hypothetical protein
MLIPVSQVRTLNRLLDEWLSIGRAFDVRQRGPSVELVAIYLSPIGAFQDACAGPLAV